MGLLDKLRNAAGGITGGGAAGAAKAAAEVGQFFPVAELPHDEDCAGCPRYPASMSIDETSELFGSAGRNFGQVLVATGQHNWKHDISDEPAPWGRALRALSGGASKFAELAGGPVRVNGTDQDIDDLPEGHVAVTVLPQFLRVVTTPDEAVAAVEAIFKVKPPPQASTEQEGVAGDAAPRGSSVTAPEATRTEIDPSAAHKPVPDSGYILLCSHTQRDKRCGVTAPILRKQLELELRHLGLYRDFYDDSPGGVRVIYVNHVGGHKFAANCFVYKNNGDAVLYARVRPQDAKALVEETVANGVVFPEIVRNCNKWAQYVW